MDVLTGLLHFGWLFLPLHVRSSARHVLLAAATRMLAQANRRPSRPRPRDVGAILVQHSDHLAHAAPWNFAEGAEERGACGKITINQLRLHLQ